MDNVSNAMSCAEAENETNSQDAFAYEAIDKFMNCPEETYDQFMESFTFLKKEDVVRPVPVAMQGTDIIQPVQSIPSTIPNIASTQSSAQTSIDCDIDEEILDEGTQTPSILTRQSSDGTGSVQLDNFVEDEGEDSLSEEGDGFRIVWDDSTCEGNSYQASFTPPNAKKEEHLPVSLADRSRTDSPGTYLATIHDNHTQNTTIISTADDTGVMPTSDDTAAILYPGEVEEVKQSPREDEIRKFSQLDFSTTVDDAIISENKESQESMTSADTNEVKPFSLDQDFDYDNVILTPKFSREEMEMMRVARQNNGFP